MEFIFSERGGTHYAKRTNKVKAKKKNKNRTQSNANLNKSLKAVRRLIDNNFEDGDGGMFITLTYGYAMTDYKQAKTDLVPVLDGLRHRKLLYLWVIEPKASGSWHFHLLVKARAGHTLELTKYELLNLWKRRGSVYIQPITQTDGLAAYLGRASQAEDTKGDDYEDGIYMLNDKKYTYSRRSFYKSGMRLYGCSQGLEKPTRIKTTKARAEKMVEGCMRIGTPQSVVINMKNATSTYSMNIVSYEEYENKKTE